MIWVVKTLEGKSYLPRMIGLLVIISDGTGSRNPGFGYPQYIRRNRSVYGKLNKAFLNIYSKLRFFIVECTVEELWKVNHQIPIAKNEEKPRSTCLNPFFRLISGTCSVTNVFLANCFLLFIFDTPIKNLLPSICTKVPSYFYCNATY